MSAAHLFAAIQPPKIADREAQRLARRATGLGVAAAHVKPNRRDRAKALTLFKVKEAARFMFVNLGYEATTMRDVADRIGMSTGAVFSAFPDGKDQMWREVMGSPAPSLRLAEEVALLQALRPDWLYILRYTGTEHVAQVHGPDWKPLQTDSAPMFMGRAASAAEALRQARLAAERHDGRRAQ